MTEEFDRKAYAEILKSDEVSKARSIKAGVDRILVQGEAAIQRTYDEGFERGRAHETFLLIQKLKGYEKDSIVARLVRELLERDQE